MYGMVEGSDLTIGAEPILAQDVLVLDVVLDHC
jgi:hypothetical protein